MKGSVPAFENLSPGDPRITNQDEQEVVVNKTDVQQGGYDEPLRKKEEMPSPKKDKDSKKVVRARKKKYDEEESE